MGKEIRNQIESLQQKSNPQHFTFDDSIKNAFDWAANREKDGPTRRSHGGNKIPFEFDEKEIPMFNDDNPTLKNKITRLEESLLEKETELKLQKDKASKDLKHCAQQYKEKNQVERLHFENSQRLLRDSQEHEIRKLKQETAQVKSDARLVIDFVRRKANEAIIEESSKVEHQKKSFGKKMEALESEMKKTFHIHLVSLEEDVNMAVKKEKKKGIGLKILPPAPPRNISIIKKPKNYPGSILRNDSIASDNTKAAELSSNDSISTCYSNDIISTGSVKKGKKRLNEHETLKSRVQELEEWTDTLTLALRTGAKITNSTRMGNPKSYIGNKPRYVDYQ
jgi:hypothetical protein